MDSLLSKEELTQLKKTEEAKEEFAERREELQKVSDEEAKANLQSFGIRLQSFERQLTNCNKLEGLANDSQQHDDGEITLVVKVKNHTTNQMEEHIIQLGNNVVGNNSQLLTLRQRILPIVFAYGKQLVQEPLAKLKSQQDLFQKFQEQQKEAQQA